MKLIRFGERGSEKPGVLVDNQRIDLSAEFRDWDSAFFAGGGIESLKNLLRRNAAGSLPRVNDAARWAAPVARPGKIVCIGLNFHDHARESGMEIPKEPILFLKASNTVAGPNDHLQIPRRSTKTDWEVELGVVIGQEARYLDSLDRAAACIAGYCISHDVSEREFQLERGGQWTKGKSCDTFSPLGPWLATADEVPGVLNASMKLWVNGQIRQNGTTGTMIFGPAQLVQYISQFMTLEPGDVISSGTPPGVGLGMKPPQYLKAGDVVELEIQGLGRQRQICVQA
ncbi:MAG TPA: fumarylacetoacetate hydrolase family protein [Dongiaceae bacterium]|nr:fumarylacetoacetate hydrolase family protein [Dongiaceae bacterium]